MGRGSSAGSDGGCILCGRCLEVCPLFNATLREELSPRAKAQLLTAGGGDEERLASMCLGCGRCAQACPQGVAVPELLGAARAGHPGWRGWIWKRWVGAAPVLWPIAGSLAGAVAPLAAGWEAGARAVRSLSALGGRGMREPWIEIGNFGRIVGLEEAVLFAGCVAGHARAAWASRAESLMAGVGLRVLPRNGFACCGSTLGQAGFPEERADLARRNLDHWRWLGRPAVVTVCATCRRGLDSYGGLDVFVDEAEARQWAESVRPLSGLLGSLEVRAAGPVSAGWHQPCHDDGTEDLGLVRRLVGEGLVVPAPKSGCCGFGGIMQLAAPGLSAEVAGVCWERFPRGGGFAVLTGCAGCAVQLAASAPTGAFASHWLDIFMMEGA